MAALRSPRHFCLACGNPIDGVRLRALGVVKTTLFGFCSPACENNFGVRMSQAPRQELPTPQRELLARIQEQLLKGRIKKGRIKIARLVPADLEALIALARLRLVNLRGRLGAVPTTRGDISYICARVLQVDLEDRRWEHRAELQREQEADGRGEPHF